MYSYIMTEYGDYDPIENNIKHCVVAIMEAFHGNIYKQSSRGKEILHELSLARATIKSEKDACDWIRTQPVLFRPIMRLQSQLRAKVIGEKFWAQLATIRYKNGNSGSNTFIFEVTKEAIARQRIQNYDRKASLLIVTGALAKRRTSIALIKDNIQRAVSGNRVKSQEKVSPQKESINARGALPASQAAK